MAKPVPLQLPARDPREELRSRLDSAPTEHADALLAAYQVLQGLHDSGMLEVLRGLLGSGDKVLETAVDAARAVFLGHMSDPSVVKGVTIMALLCLVSIIIGARAFGRAVA